MDMARERRSRVNSSGCRWQNPKPNRSRVNLGDLEATLGSHGGISAGGVVVVDVDRVTGHLGVAWRSREKGQYHWIGEMNIR